MEKELTKKKKKKKTTIFVLGKNVWVWLICGAVGGIFLSGILTIPADILGDAVAKHEVAMGKYEATKEEYFETLNWYSPYALYDYEYTVAIDSNGLVYITDMGFSRYTYEKNYYAAWQRDVLYVLDTKKRVSFGDGEIVMLDNDYNPYLEQSLYGNRNARRASINSTNGEITWHQESKSMGFDYYPIFHYEFEVAYQFSSIPKRIYPYGIDFQSEDYINVEEYKVYNGVSLYYNQIEEGFYEQGKEYYWSGEYTLGVGRKYFYPYPYGRRDYTTGKYLPYAKDMLDHPVIVEDFASVLNFFSKVLGFNGMVILLVALYVITYESNFITNVAKVLSVKKAIISARSFAVGIGKSKIGGGKIE